MARAVLGAGGGLRALAGRYYGIALTSTKEKFVYRFDFFLSLFVTLLGMALMVYLWQAIAREAGPTLGYDLRELLTYICLGQGVQLRADRLGAAAVALPRER